MTIRDTTESDAEQLAALVDSVARERRYLAILVGFPTEAIRAFLATVKAARGAHVVAEDGGVLVGWCDILPYSFEGMRHVGRLGMGVKREFRKQGVGRKLLEAAVQRAFQSEIERVELEVFASNLAAVRLYESRGFRLEGRKIAARKLDGMIEDVLIYALLK